MRLHDTIEENLRHTIEDIAESAADALRSFGKLYYVQAREAVLARVDGFVAKVWRDELPGVRRGYALALGALPKEIAAARRREILSELIIATRLEVRRTALIVTFLKVFV